MTIEEQICFKAEKLHNEIKGAIGKHPLASNVTVVTIASMHDSEKGQWIIAAPEQDKAAIVKRLRLCADLLEAEKIRHKRNGASR
jgi:hypothetical protein